MVRPVAAASQRNNDMGQTSSQLHDAATNHSTMEDQPKSSGKKHKKSKNGKRKSAEVDPSVGLKGESARASLQMSGVGMRDNRAPSNGIDPEESQQQLIAEISQMRSPGPVNVQVIEAGSSKKRGSRRNGGKKAKRKRSGGDVLEYPSSEDRNEEERVRQTPPVTPTRTNHSSPSPYRRNISQSQHVLDDIPTDEETAVFDEAFGTPNHDIFSFSQQPPDLPDRLDDTYPSYQLPFPKVGARPQKRKRDTVSVVDKAGEHQLPVANGAGQCMLEHEMETFDDLFQVDLGLADSFFHNEDNDMPIDPELDSMNPVPSSVDLGALHIMDDNVRQTKKRRSKHSGLSQSSKRRRVDEFQSTDGKHELSHNPYTSRDGQENIQDRVLPGVEDLQRHAYPELGTPFMERVARGGLEYLNNTSKSVKAARGKKGKEKEALRVDPATVNSPGEKEKQSQRSLKDIKEKGGPWLPAETTKLDTFRDRYCDANSMSHELFNSLIQTSIRGNTQVTALYNELHDVLPYRPRMSLQKFVRRRFHNFAARGTWTREEDEILRQAVVEKGKQWKIVGEMIDRMPGDCRDRWRNYILNADKRNREQWTDEEVRNLCSAIMQCMQLMKEERRRAREEIYGPDSQDYQESPDQDVEDMKDINWQSVSDRMGEHGGGRSRLQCSFKWGQLKKTHRDDTMNLIREARGLEVKRSGPTNNPWRQRRAFKKVANMRTGDQYSLLKFILKSNAPTEGNIPWKSLGDEEFRAIWTVADRKSAWSVMKESVPGSDTMDYREVINRLVTRIFVEGAEELDERWDPEVHGDVSQTKPNKSKKTKGKEREENGTDSKRKKKSRKRKEKRKLARSSEYIEESDNDEEGTAADQLRSYNPYDTLPRSAKANRYADTNNEAASSTADDDEEEEEEAGQIRNPHTKNADQDSLFDKGPDEESEYRPTNIGEVSPEMASRIHLLKFA